MIDTHPQPSANVAHLTDTDTTAAVTARTPEPCNHCIELCACPAPRLWKHLPAKVAEQFQDCGAVWLEVQHARKMKHAARSLCEKNGVGASEQVAKCVIVRLRGCECNTMQRGLTASATPESEAGE
jgi:hypothetical protein